MSTRVGPMTLTRPSLFLPVDTVREAVSQEVAAAADAEIRRLVDEAQERAASILSQRRGDLERLTKLLLEHETLEEPELAGALTDRDAPIEPSPPATARPTASAGSRASA
jgi:cell division protease FtsH